MSDPSIRVEPGELNNFAQDVKFDADVVFQPAVDRAGTSLSGIRFGQNNASGTVHAAKQRYSKALTAHLENLRNYLEAAQIMASAAELVAREFDAVDERSAEAVARVDAMLRTATDEARAAAEPKGTRAGGKGLAI